MMYEEAMAKDDNASLLIHLPLQLHTLGRHRQYNLDAPVLPSQPDSKLCKPAPAVGLPPLQNTQ